MKEKVKSLMRLMMLSVMALLLAVFIRMDAYADGYGAVVEIRNSGGSYTVSSYEAQEIYVLDENYNGNIYIGATNHVRKLNNYSLKVTINTDNKTYFASLFAGTVDNDGNYTYEYIREMKAYELSGEPVSCDTLYNFASNMGQSSSFGAFFWVNGEVPVKQTITIKAPDFETDYNAFINTVNLFEKGAYIEGDAHGADLSELSPRCFISGSDVTGDYVDKDIIIVGEAYNMSDESKVRVKVNPMDVSRMNYNAFSIDEQEATGSEVCPDIATLRGTQASILGLDFVKGTDYDITYEDNIYATDNAKAIVHFKGKYKGEKTFRFAIKRVALPEGAMVITMEDWTEGDTPSVADVDSPLFFGTENAGTEVNRTITYYEKGSETPLSQMPTHAGEYTVKADFEDGRIYEGLSVSCDFTINEKPAPAPVNNDNNTTPAHTENQTPSSQESTPDTHEAASEVTETPATTAPAAQATTAPAAPAKKNVTEKKSTETVDIKEEALTALGELKTEDKEEAEEVNEEIKEEVKEEVKEEAVKEEPANASVTETEAGDEDTPVSNVPEITETKKNESLPPAAVAAIVIGSMSVLSAAGIGIFKYLALIKK